MEGVCPAITQECAYLIRDSYAYNFVVAKLLDRQLRLVDLLGSVFGICQVKFKVLEQRQVGPRAGAEKEGVETDYLQSRKPGEEPVQAVYKS